MRNPLPGTRCNTSRSCCAVGLLVAGFHARFGPPSPFSTTLTVYASARPVTCFSHSRPWGWAPVSLLCVFSHPSEDKPFQTQGVGCIHSRGSRLARSSRGSHRVSFAPPLRSQATVPAPAPRYVRLGLRLLPASCSPEDVHSTIVWLRRRAGCPARPPRLSPWCAGSDPVAGFPLPCVSTLDRVLPLPRAGLPGTNRVVADPVRLALPARPALACPAVRVCRLSATTFPILLTACAGASSVRWPCCRLRGLVINL